MPVKGATPRYSLLEHHKHREAQCMHDSSFIMCIVTRQSFAAFFRYRPSGKTNHDCSNAVADDSINRIRAPRRLSNHPLFILPWNVREEEMGHKSGADYPVNNCPLHIVL